jgi:hypothetical protein
MQPSQFNTQSVLNNIKAIDEAYPGSMKKAGIIVALFELLGTQTPANFDPNSVKSFVTDTDELLPGSMKEAALVYIMAQLSVATRVVESGVAQLVNGSATVNSVNASASNAILLAYYSMDGAQATISYGNLNAGVSFGITSSKSNDTNLVSWAILSI